MRTKFKVLLSVNSLIVFLLAYSFLDLIRLLYDGSSKFRIPEQEIEKFGTESAENASQKIPKIIHQSYFGLESATLPEKWQESQQSIKLHHADYQYILWDRHMARDFLVEHYPWFIETYDSYPHHMMRIDALRYFILHHYGGIYIDLDYGARTNLDGLLQYPAWLRKTTPTGVSNDLLGSAPRHPFFEKLIESLQGHYRNWGFPYVTVMYSTGPLFVSMIFQNFKNYLLPEGQRVRVLYPSSTGNDISRLLYRVEGSSWHRGDAKYFLFIKDHPIFSGVLIVSLVLTFLYAQLMFYQYLLSGKARSLRRIFWSSRPSAERPSNDIFEDELSDFSDGNFQELEKHDSRESWNMA